MKFEDTKLPKEKLVEDAFNFAQDYNKILAPEMEQEFRQQIELSYEMELLFLKGDKEAGQMTEEKYNMYKSRLDMQKDAQLKQMALIVEQQVEMTFRTQLGSVQEINNHSDKSSPALLAATLLAGCVRDPIDYRNLEDKFGGAIGGLVAEILHINSYPGRLQTSLADASADAKRIFMARMASELSAVVEQKKQLGKQFLLPPKYEETTFSNAKILWGNDKKQDARLVDVFNKSAEARGVNYRIELTTAGAPDLVESARKVPPKMLPPGPKKPPIKGDDGF